MSVEEISLAFDCIVLSRGVRRNLLLKPSYNAAEFRSAHASSLLQNFQQLIKIMDWLYGLSNPETKYDAICCTYRKQHCFTDLKTNA